jgi:hypothetical protein
MIYSFLGAVYFYFYLKTYKNKIKTKSKKSTFYNLCQQVQAGAGKNTHNGRMDLT